MDDKDFAVLRWLSTDGVARFWGSRRVLDPRITAREIARRVGTSETSVRMRLRSLGRQGLLLGHEVWPNPALFGARELFVEVRVRATREVARLFDECALVDGVVLARDWIGPEARKVQIYLVDHDPADTERRLALLRRLVQPEPLLGPFPVHTPEGPGGLGRLDWELLREMLRHPEHGVARLARDMGVSLKTVARRFHALLDSRACWYTPGPDTEDGPWSFVRVVCRGPAERQRVADDVGRLFPSWMPLAAESAPAPPGQEGREFSGLLLTESLAQLERGVRRIETIDGVEGTFQGFALGTRTYPAWFRQQIAARLGEVPMSHRTATVPASAGRRRTSSGLSRRPRQSSARPRGAPALRPRRSRFRRRSEER